MLPSEGFHGIDRYSVAVITGATSFTGLLTEHRSITQAHDGLTFITLDELDQCRYTSGHAANAHGFGTDLEYPIDESPGALAVYEAAVFAETFRRLTTPELCTEWTDLADALIVDASGIEALVAINRDPDCLIDAVHVVQNVPEAGGAGLLANIPNGYFEGDLTPFQNLAITQRLAQMYGYTPFGIGARTLGFIRPFDNSDRPNVHGIIADLQHLYGHPESPAWSDLAAVLEASPVLILGYTEDFAELVSEG